MIPFNLLSSQRKLGSRSINADHEIPASAGMTDISVLEFSQ